MKSIEERAWGDEGNQQVAICHLAECNITWSGGEDCDKCGLPFEDREWRLFLPAPPASPPMSSTAVFERRDEAICLRCTRRWGERELKRNHWFTSLLLEWYKDNAARLKDYDVAKALMEEPKKVNVEQDIVNMMADRIAEDLESLILTPRGQRVTRVQP